MVNKSDNCLASNLSVAILFLILSLCVRDRLPANEIKHKQNFVSLRKKTQKRKSITAGGDNNK